MSDVIVRVGELGHQTYVKYDGFVFRLYCNRPDSGRIVELTPGQMSKLLKFLADWNAL